MSRELRIELEAVHRAEKAGWMSRKLSWQGRRGAPDRAFIGFGRFVLIEFKRPGEEPIGQQLREFNRLAERYDDVHWVDNVGHALEILGVQHG